MRRRPRILAIVLAGGEGDRLGPLTDERAKPAMPFAGTYRLIDFPLSNCVHSGIRDVWIVQQYEPHELTRQLANGRPWDLDRNAGGLQIVHPYLGDAESGWYEGNADALHRNREAVERHDADLLLVLSADAVYRLDYGRVVDAHLASGAAVTMVTTRVERDEATRYGVVQTDAGGAVTDFEYKPSKPRSDVVTTEIFVYETRALLDTLAELAGENEEEGLRDFGHELLPRFVATQRAHAIDLGGYWRDVGTIESYWAAHMELLENEPPFVLEDPNWPILTASPLRPPARIEGSARIDASLVAPGACVRGTVERSVLGPGVVVDEGAVVRDSVLLHDAQVAASAVVSRAIVDERVHVEAGDEIGGDGITVVGSHETLAV